MSDKPLTIFLPKRLTQTGGTSTFARNLKYGLEKRGHTVTFAWQPEYNVLLASPTAPMRYLAHARLNHRPAIHRLDGVYYPGSSAGRLWKLLNFQLSVIRKYFANGLVYQSRYSEQACNRALLPLARKTPSTTIYNGVDTHHFSPTGTAVPLKDSSKQHLFITASRFRTPDQIIPLLKTFFAYRKAYTQNTKLILIGPFEERVKNIPREYKNAPGVSFIGVITHAQLPSYLRSADVFLMTHKSPPCPNNILEALACGLPVCGVADGSMPELITSGKEGELVSEPSATHVFPSQALAHLANRIMRNRAEYAKAARKRAISDFSISTMIDKYELLLRQIAQS